MPPPPPTLCEGKQHEVVTADTCDDDRKNASCTIMVENVSKQNENGKERKKAISPSKTTMATTGTTLSPIAYQNSRSVSVSVIWEMSSRCKVCVSHNRV